MPRILRCRLSPANDEQKENMGVISSGGEDQQADALALLFSLLGGFFMGAYPVPIKACHCPAGA